MFVSDENLLGWLPLQNFDFEDEGFREGGRHVVYACRVGPRHGVTEEGSQQLGHHNVLAVGDILSGYLWDREAERRQMHAWSFAWLAIAKKGSGRTVRAKPADGSYAADERFAIPTDIGLPPSRRTPAAGEMGMVVRSTKEGAQEGLWFSGSDLMVSQWRGPAPAEHSTLMYDISAADALSDVHVAKISTAWHVGFGARVRGSAGFDPAIVAWNLTTDVGDARGQGFTINREVVLGVKLSVPESAPELSGPLLRFQSGSVGFVEFSRARQTPTGRRVRGSVDTVPEITRRFGLSAVSSGAVVYAHASWEHGGPLNAGHPGDQHVIGINRDGVRVLPQHLGINSIYLGGMWDCPLEFRQEKYPRATRFPFMSEVHLTVDFDMTHSWIAAPDDIRTGAGLGRWFAYVPFNEAIHGHPPEEPPPPPPPPPPPKEPPFLLRREEDPPFLLRRTEEQPPEDETLREREERLEEERFQRDIALFGPEQQIVPPEVLDPPPEGAVFPEHFGGIPGFPEAGEAQDEPRAEPGTQSAPNPMLGTQAVAFSPELSPSPDASRRGVAGIESVNEIIAPGFVGKASQPWLQDRDLRYESEISDEQKTFVEDAPQVARIEFFGCRDFKTTETGNSRSASGTAIGGVLICQPEVDIADLREGQTTRLREAVGTTGVSTTQMWLSKTVQLRFGTEWNDVSGLVVDGFSTTQLDTEELQTSTVSLGLRDQDVHKIHIDGHFEFQVGTRHPMRRVTDADAVATQLDHTINMDPTSADRTLTLPDAAQFEGLVLQVKNVHFTPPGPARKVVIQPILGQNIEDDTDFTLNGGASVTVKAEGGDWYVY